MSDDHESILQLRNALGCFVTGVTVIVTRSADGVPRGFTANSFSSVSLRPPLLSICVDHRAASIDVFRRCETFTINVLSESQQDTSNLFASKGPDKFERVPWSDGELGIPILDDAVAWFECRPHQRHEAGDHLLMIGEVINFQANDQRPLGFCRGNYISFGLSQQAVLNESAEIVRVGCILERGGRIVLVPNAAGDGWELPIADAQDGHQSTSLRALLEASGIEATFDFLFSVFDDTANGELLVYYRGEVSRGPIVSGPARLFDYHEIPWPELPCDAQRGMLTRYVEERERFRFGIYFGSTDAGSVLPAGPPDASG